VGLQVVVIRHLLVVKRRRHEDVQILEAAPLRSSVTVRSNATSKRGWALKEAKQVPLLGLSSTTQMTG
jgi:hypothetical protein